jgi:hypothetical protein
MVCQASLASFEFAVHLLCSLPPTLALADGLRLIKTNRSRWVHGARRALGFGCQARYGAFSVSQSLAPAPVRYIREQEKHHLRMAFQEELIALLKRHGIAYDKRYLWS